MARPLKGHPLRGLSGTTDGTSAPAVTVSTYAALRTALAAGTYQVGQMVFCEGREAAGDGGQGNGQVSAIGSSADDGWSVLTGGALAWKRRDISDESFLANEVAGYAYGSTIYVDSINGSDSNTGLSFDSPLQSLVGVQNLVVDGISRLAIRRGSSFRTPLTITSTSFTEARPFGVVAYGQGPRPIISGGVVQDGPWALESGTEYSTTANATVAAASSAIPAYYITDAGLIVRLNRGTAGSLAAYEWDLSGGKVFINVGGAVTGVIEVPAFIPIVVSASHVYLHGIETRFSGNDGISITGTPDNIVCANVVANWNANDGINALSGATNVRIVGSTISDNGRENDGAGDGFSAHVAGTGVICGCVIERNCKDGISNSSQGTWRIVGNRINHNSQGIVVYPEAGVAGAHTIHRNIIRGAFANEISAAVRYHMLLDAGSAGATITAVNNTMVRGENVASFPRGVRIPGGTVVFKNNTVSGAYQIGILVAGTPTLTEENNNVFGATTNVSGFSLDASSIQADPEFVDDANGDYTLGAGSALRDAGQTVAGITLRNVGAAPDIGAIESA